MSNLAQCPKCGGYPDFDEDGRELACFFCCDSGLVDAVVAAEYRRAEAWAEYLYREAKILKPLNKKPAAFDFEFDDIPF